MNQQLFLNFYNITGIFNSSNEIVFKKICRDFFYFKSPFTPKEQMFDVFTHDESFETSTIANAVAIASNSKCITYKMNNNFYHDYHGQGWIKENKEKNIFHIYSQNLDLLYELSFLTILSVSGKILDAKGLHKIHALGINYKENDIVIMMPMGGGKSTLLLSLLENKNVAIISDDTPLIDRCGNLHPFPLRIGLKNIPESFLFLKDKIETMKRLEHGEKFIIPLNVFENKIKASSKDTNKILINANRTLARDGKIIQISKARMFIHLSKHMIVGLGLPVILELFLSHGPSDFFKLCSLAAKRTIAATRLLLTCKTYQMYLGTDLKFNKKLVLDLAEKI